MFSQWPKECLKMRTHKCTFLPSNVIHHTCQTNMANCTTQLPCISILQIVSVRLNRTQRRKKKSHSIFLFVCTDEMCALCYKSSAIIRNIGECRHPNASFRFHYILWCLLFQIQFWWHFCLLIVRFSLRNGFFVSDFIVSWNQYNEFCHFIFSLSLSLSLGWIVLNAFKMFFKKLCCCCRCYIYLCFYSTVRV